MNKNTLIALFTLLVSFPLFSQNGLRADYYNGTNFERFVGTQIETDINYYWSNDPPFKGINPNECSIRWTGRLMSPKTGDITFLARVDDGIRVWVGGVQIIDNWQLNDVGYSKGTIKMKEGEYYDIKIEYFNALFEGEIKLFWIFPRAENLSWYENLWYEDKEEIVPGKYFLQPQEEEKVVELEEEEITPSKPEKITPKKKRTIPVKPKVTKEIAIENYIPKNVQFERAKTEILPESFTELDRLADFLIKNPHHKIKIEGHTDNVGDAEKNVQLSHSRARAVAVYLIKKGVHHERLAAEGFGGSRPLVKSDGRKYHPENRRVEFIVE
ncbi:MAG: outer membrane protein OmpA-like peptidoglycan-associated protein [Saprospiraceae bacterium]|jgi:outer membrane protein OmpA-like peptidoglycan-associated protein